MAPEVEQHKKTFEAHPLKVFLVHTYIYSLIGREKGACSMAKETLLAKLEKIQEILDRCDDPQLESLKEKNREHIRILKCL